MVDIRPLRYFLALAETLNFGRAAASLKMSQPPLTRQIAALELEMGAKLVDRHSRGVTLTAAGERLQIDAKALFIDLERAKANVRAVSLGQKGTLTLGFTTASALTVIPTLMRRFTQQWPEVLLNVQELMPLELAGRLLDGQIDAAVMFPIGKRSGIGQRPVYKESMCLALSDKHPKAMDQGLALQELSGDAFIAARREGSPALRQAVESYCEAAGFEPHVKFEVSTQQTVLGLVADGAGVAIVPTSMSKLRVENVVFKPLPGGAQIEQVIAWSLKNANPCLINLRHLAEELYAAAQ